MKKLGILALATLMVVAFAMPASALENTFGGHWRSEFVSLNDVDGASGTVGTSSDDDESSIYSRLRLYYTAGLNDNLKIVTKFEVDYMWGDVGIGDIGADQTGMIEVKNIYADFNLGPVNAKMGTHGFTIARGIVFDTDASGITLTYSPMDMVTIPFVWIKAAEDATGGANDEDNDFDIFGLVPVFKFGEGISVQPMIVKAATDNLAAANPLGVIDSAGGIAGAIAPAVLPAATELDSWFYGLDASASFGPLSLYGVYVAQSGEISPPGMASIDLSGFAMDFGVGYDFGMFSLRGEYAYLSGDDDGLGDNDLEAFTSTDGESWAKGELMMNNGLLVNAGGPAASPWMGGDPAQSTFFNTSSGMKLWTLGATVKPIDKLDLKLDYFNGSYAETAAGANDDVGSEIDFVATYQLIEGLQLDVLACFYSIGDAVNPAGTSDEDQVLYGARFSVNW